MLPKRKSVISPFEATVVCTSAKLYLYVSVIPICCLDYGPMKELIRRVPLFDLIARDSS